MPRLLSLLLLSLLPTACERKGQPVEPEPVACPADAMVCPDGTAVGRTGPNCTFPPCPADPCAGVELPACPPACADDATSRCGQPCEAEGEACGNEIGDGMVCQGGTWSCIVHPPLGPGCNAVCRRAPGP